MVISWSLSASFGGLVVNFVHSLQLGFWRIQKTEWVNAILSRSCFYDLLRPGGGFKHNLYTSIIMNIIMYNHMFWFIYIRFWIYFCSIIIQSYCISVTVHVGMDQHLLTTLLFWVSEHLGQVLVREEHDQEDGGEPRGETPSGRRAAPGAFFFVVWLIVMRTDLWQNLRFLKIFKSSLARTNHVVSGQGTVSFIHFL